MDMDTAEKSLLPPMSAPVLRARSAAPAVNEGSTSVAASNWGCLHFCGSSTNRCYLDCVAYAESQPH